MIGLIKQFVMFGNFYNITFHDTDPIHEFAKELGYQLIVKQDPETKVFAGDRFESPYRPTLANENQSVKITFNCYKIIINIENYKDEEIFNEMENLIKKVCNFVDKHYDIHYTRLGLNGYVALNVEKNETLFDRFLSNSKLFTQNKQEWSVREVQKDFFESEPTNVCYNFNKIVERNYQAIKKPLNIDLSLCLNYDVNTLQKNNKPRFNTEQVLNFYNYASETSKKIFEFVGE